MSKPVLISGIQPTGRLHLGNYLGALKNFVELQNSSKYDCYFFVADYHSLTVDFDPETKAQETLDVAKAYLAAGINPKKSLIFSQSDIKGSGDLMWILNVIAPVGEMERMTQYKDKAKSQPANINMGLLNYPLLMAADIFLYNAKFVPVGDDQLQHLELARTLARKFNKRFGQTFIEPQSILTKTPRVMSLDNPEKKMSKSSPNSCLFLDDSPEEIESKIKRAVTDSGSEIKYDRQNKAGVSNLLEIYSELSGKAIPAIEKMCAGKGYGQFKTDLAKVVTDALKPFREVKSKKLNIKSMLDAGAKKAQKIAEKKMGEVKQKIGLLQ
ncbi:MAG: tryptophan--tRNA ligase [bacterium]|nr:tryptophan--tRNA ligase [bacterium]